jgi:hypothetical protein
VSNTEFRGDFDRNEVEMDLAKFMDLIKENSDLKDQIRESGVDKVHPHQRMLDFATTVDAWRIFPRAFITVYLVLLYNSTTWFMGLSDPTMAQTGLISTIVGAGAAWFAMYTRTNGDGGNK